MLLSGHMSTLACNYITVTEMFTSGERKDKGGRCSFGLRASGHKKDAVSVRYKNTEVADFGHWS